jgi:L-seryl-tRNA(Ser) seleniumtransferase
VGVYEELGVRPFINTVAPHTRYGGAIMPPSVVAAMAEAARRSVNLHELQEAAGADIAARTRNAGCYIAAGAASGIQLAVAACIVGADEGRALGLPRSAVGEHVLMLASQEGTEAETAIRNTGAEIRWVRGEGEAAAAALGAAVGGGTAAVVVMDWQGGGAPEVRDVVREAHARGVPVIVDAADGVPPSSGFWRHTRVAGADAVVISGGKGIRGPQDTGLVLGTRAIVEGCRYLGSPHDRFGRSMKVSKEAMVGIHAAVKHFLEHEHALADAAHARAEALLRDLADLGEATRSGGEVIVRLRSRRPSDEEVRARLLDGDPAVLVSCRSGTIRVSASILQPGDEEVVARRLRAVLA